MTILKELKGRGRLTAIGVSSFEVSYELTVRQNDKGQFATGRLFSDDDRLIDVYVQSSTRLMLSDGSTCEIVLTETRAKIANFKSSGPMPEI